MYYASFGILALIIHVITNIGVIKKPISGETPVVYARYRAFLYGLILYYISDISWGFLHETRIVPLVYSDTVLFFLSMGLSLVLWMRFVISYLSLKEFFAKFFLFAAWGAFIFEIAVLAINIYTPIMFGFAADGEYNPGRARYITLDIQVIIFGLIAVVTLIMARKTSEDDRRHNVAVGISCLVMTLFVILQEKDPFLPYYAVGCLITTCIVNTYVGIDNERELGSVKQIAFIDTLTNVKNVNSYLIAKQGYEELIAEDNLKEMGLMVFDVNNLKKVNDSEGHEAGDRYLQAAAKLICDVAKHSPVYRIGGDEFVAILEGEDYLHCDELLETFDLKVLENKANGGPVVACGMSKYRPEADTEFDAVFKRADIMMYEHKKQLKK